MSRAALLQVRAARFRTRVSISGGMCAAVCGIALITGTAARAQFEAPEQPSVWTEKSAVAARHFMVAAANPLATEAGYRILKQGGSVVDAAVAMQMVLNLVEPQSSGIGGGSFLLLFDRTHNRLAAYDGRETAPAAATPGRFLDDDGKPMQLHDAIVGGRSVGVPGNLRLLELAHRRHGRLAWVKLFEPAIELAEQGFEVSPRLAGALAREQYLKRQAVARDYFYHGDGTPLKAGERLRNPRFAAVLKRVAAGGARAFYEGEIARDIVAAVNAAPIANTESHIAADRHALPTPRASAMTTAAGTMLAALPTPVIAVQELMKAMS